MNLFTWKKMFLMSILNIVGTIWIVIGCLSALIILVDVTRNPQQMKIMDAVWPINALWGGPLILWTYFTLGKHRKMQMGMPMNQKKTSMKMDLTPKDLKYNQYWQGIIVDALHCGAGCSLSDLIGSWIFYYLITFSLFDQKVLGEWLFDYILALIIGILFQYAAIGPMLKGSVAEKLLRAFKIDFWSLTAWQVGMYGWSAIETFGLHLHFTPLQPAFWVMMSIGMACGFLTAYPMNWFLVKKGIKKGM